MAAAAVLAASAPAGPALAEIQTVPASEAARLAQPFKQQPVNKGRIWLLMVLGGAALFGRCGARREYVTGGGGRK